MGLSLGRCRTRLLSCSKYISPSDSGDHMAAAQLSEAVVRIRHDQAESQNDILFCMALLVSLECWFAV